MKEKKQAEFEPFCYNCAEYNTKTSICNYLSKKKESLDTCANFLERSNYSEKEIKEMTKPKREKKFESPWGPIRLDNYIENVQTLWNQNPFFYDNGLFWLWNKEANKYKLVNDIQLMNLLDGMLGLEGQTVTSSVKSNYVEAFKRIGQKQKPKDPPTKWIQFKDKAFSLSSENIYKVTPDYFFANPIPWEIGPNDKTPIMDKLMEEWVGKEYMQTAYEIIAYCCYANYPIHLIFCLVGCGRNGKSKFIGLINKFIGNENICSTELDILISSRFEGFKLYKKLVCCMGETNFGVINKTSLLKKLTGQDLTGIEYKNKEPFDIVNYAKILIASNSLPTSEDTSEGFYRRWMILDFPNIFPEGKDILETIPKAEYTHLACKVTKLLPELLKRHKFIKQGTIDERRNRYIMASNPLSHFIETACEKDFTYFMRYSELFTAYRRYLHTMKKRAIGYREFNNVLAIEGLEVEKTSKKINEEWVNGKFILGVHLKPNWEKEVDVLDMLDMNQNHIKSLYKELKQNQSIIGTTSTNPPESTQPIEYEELIDPQLTHCRACGKDKCYISALGHFFCDKSCYEAYKGQEAN